jgi:hypothetical protein
MRGAFLQTLRDRMGFLEFMNYFSEGKGMSRVHVTVDQVHGHRALVRLLH